MPITNEKKQLDSIVSFEYYIDGLKYEQINGSSNHKSEEYTKKIIEENKQYYYLCMKNNLFKVIKGEETDKNISKINNDIALEVKDYLKNGFPQRIKYASNDEFFQ